MLGRKIGQTKSHQNWELWFRFFFAIFLNLKLKPKAYCNLNSMNGKRLTENIWSKYVNSPKVIRSYEISIGIGLWCYEKNCVNTYSTLQFQKFNLNKITILCVIILISRLFFITQNSDCGTEAEKIQSTTRSWQNLRCLGITKHIWLDLVFIRTQ